LIDGNLRFGGAHPPEQLFCFRHPPAALTWDPGDIGSKLLTRGKSEILRRRTRVQNPPC
jgi:hypothetical protein